MKPSRLSSLFALGLAVAAAPGLAQPVMKVGTATINDVQHEWAKRFAARVAKQAPGKLKVEVYPAEQLGNNARMLEGLTIGTVEAAYGAIGSKMQVDIWVPKELRIEKRLVPGRVVERPFYNPPHRLA